MYIHQNRFINNAQRIFANSLANEVADRILPIEIQPIQGKAREVRSSKHSGVEVATCSNFPRLNQRISAHSENTSNRMLLEELEKEVEGGAKFKPVACSTPKSKVINENEDKKTTTKILENINASTKYSKGDIDKKLSEKPVISRFKKETRKMLIFSRNPDETSKSVQNIEKCVDNSNNKREFTDSTYTGDAVNKKDIVLYKKPKKANVVEININRNTDETKNWDAEQSQENQKTKYSDGSKSKPMKSSHPPSEGFNGLRRSSRIRKSPIAYWSCRFQNFKLDKEKEKNCLQPTGYNNKKMPYLKKKNKTKIQRPKRTLKIDENKENLIG